MLTKGQQSLETVCSQAPGECPFASACVSLPGRCVVPLLAAIVFLSSLPDAMVAPLLHDLLVARYGVSESAAHAFMIVNIVGGLAAVLWLRRSAARHNPRRTIAAAASINGVLLVVMALPIGFGATIGVRIAEGAADLVVFAGLFDLLRQSTRSTRCAARLGLGGTMLMLGLAAGMAMSGPLSAAGEGAAFVVGGVACMLAAIAAIRLPGRCSAESTHTSANHHHHHHHHHHHAAAQPRVATAQVDRPALWPVLVMAGSDRALGALLAVSVPMHVATSGSIPRATVGAAIAVAMLLMAIGAWAGGAMADRFDAARSRAVAAVIYGTAFLVLPAAIDSSAIFILAMVAIGVSGAVLLPSMLALAGRSGGGAAAMGAAQAAGNIGFAAGIIAAAGVLQLASAGDDRAALYRVLLQGAGLCYLALNGLAAAAAKAPTDIPQATAPVTVTIDE